MKIVIPGGSGQVGTVLTRYFADQGHDIIILSRNPQEDEIARYVAWNGKDVEDNWRSEIDGADVVINLAGKNVNCRYTDKNKRLIMNSRIDSTEAVGKAIAMADNPPHTWIQASTATIYAHTFDEGHDEFDGKLGGGEEGAPDKWDFSVEVAKTWEYVADQMVAELDNTRLVKMRTSLVMSPDRDGIFDTLLGLVRFGLGGKAGSGEQYVSWIHHIDFVRMVAWLIDHDEVDGVINITAPNPIPFKKFMKILRDVWGIRIGLPATKWMLEIAAFFMRTETELILKSRKVLPGKLEKMGFDFSYEEWEDAAADLVADWRDRRK